MCDPACCWLIRDWWAHLRIAQVLCCFPFFSMRPAYGHVTSQTFLLEIGRASKSNGDPYILSFLRSKSQKQFITLEFTVLVWSEIWVSYYNFFCMFMLWFFGFFLNDFGYYCIWALPRHCKVKKIWRSVSTWCSQCSETDRVVDDMNYITLLFAIRWCYETPYIFNNLNNV